MTNVLTINARCRHNNPIPSEEEGCGLCDWENEILSRKPPFMVECIDGKGLTELTEGDHYTVLAIILEGAAVAGCEAPGIMLEADGKLVFPYLYKADRFMLVQK